MMKKVLFLILGLMLLSASNIFADDVSIDSNGNLKTGVSNTNAELEVTGGSGEGGILGSASGTGASGVYGINTTYGNYGVLGYDTIGVFGYSLSGYAGYFQGNARVTGNLTVDGTFNVTETDPQVGTLTNGMWCTTNGTQVNCTSAAPVTSETDPTVNALGKATLSCSGGQVAKWNGANWVCADDTGITSETDPEVGSNNTNYVPKWNGSALVAGTIYDNGNIGIGTSAPGAKFHVERAIGDYGADKASIYGFRPGSDGATNGGTGWGVGGVDTAIKAYNLWGNQYTSGIAGYSYLDYGNSAAVVGAKYDGSNRGMLGYKDSNDNLWAGYFEGNVKVNGGVTFADGTVQTSAKKDCNGGRYEDNGDGTVSDCRTGLIWQKDSSCFSAMTWDAAMSAAANLASGDCGLTDDSSAGDWRLPTKTEWMAMVASARKQGFTNPSLTNSAGTGQWTSGDAFLDVQSSDYWSSTTYAGNPNAAWYVDFYDGHVSISLKNGNYYVRCVRAGQ